MNRFCLFNPLTARVQNKSCLFPPSPVAQQPPSPLLAYSLIPFYCKAKPHHTFLFCSVEAWASTGKGKKKICDGGMGEREIFGFRSVQARSMWTRSMQTEQISLSIVICFSVVQLKTVSKLLPSHMFAEKFGTKHLLTHYGYKQDSCNTKRFTLQKRTTEEKCRT